jgi:DNA-directed RNA polymerase subunit RPC12/RpoP/membrane protein implicated in regulation of membrane protease activity
MVGSGKTLGIILMIGAGLLLIAFGAWATTALLSSETTSGGAVLGILLALLVIAPVFGLGAYLFRKGGQEQREMAQVQKEKQILNAVLTRGQVTINELVADMQLPREDIQRMVQDLVGKQLFSGAVNWDKGILYSVESQKLTGDSKCPNCGGDLVFAGKGLIVCPYCGSQVFLTKRAAETTANPAPAAAPEAVPPAA